jgi:hypothetical protein
MSIKQTKLTDFFLVRKRPAIDKLAPDIHEDQIKRLKCHFEEIKPAEEAKFSAERVKAAVGVAVKDGLDAKKDANCATSDSKPMEYEEVPESPIEINSDRDLNDLNQEQTAENQCAREDNADSVTEEDNVKVASNAYEARAHLGGNLTVDIITVKMHKEETRDDNVASDEGVLSGENNMMIDEDLSRGHSESIANILVAADRSEVTPKRAATKLLSTMEKLCSSTPKLTDHDIVISIPDSPRKYLSSPLAAASPRKNVAATLALDRVNLWQHAHALDLPMPARYRFLGEAFRAVDHICSLKHNRSERILVTEVKRSVGRAISRAITDAHLGQLCTVFPQAYFFAWEHISVGNRTKLELTMTPNLNFHSDWLAGRRTPEPSPDNSQKSMTPESLVERRRIFNNVLLSIVMDQHNLHLKQIDPLMTVDESKLTRWDSDFNPDKDCADVEVWSLPEAPGSVVKPKAVRNLFGGEPVKIHINTDAIKAEIKSEVSAEDSDRPQVLKELEQLPQSIVLKIMDKERERRLNSMMETPLGKKQRLMLEELQSVRGQSSSLNVHFAYAHNSFQMGPVIANCYRSERKRLKSGAVSAAGFFRFVADSCGNKSQSEVEALVRHLALVAPDFFEIFELGGPEYFKQKPQGELSNAALRQHLAKLLTETNRKRL